MAFNPHTAEDRSEMLAVIGIDDVSELFDPIPAGVRRPIVDLPPGLTEMEAAAYLDKLASKNLVPKWRRFVPGRGIIPALFAGDGFPIVAARRVVYGIYPVPARGCAGHPADHL